MESSHQAVSYVIKEITFICSDMGKRAPGSESEHRAGGYMAKVFERDCGCNDVRMDSFGKHPDMYCGYFWFSAVFDCPNAVLITTTKRM